MAGFKGKVTTKRGKMAKITGNSGRKEVMIDFPKPLEFPIASFVTVDVVGQKATVSQEGRKQIGKLRGRSAGEQLY